jgi:uncharacterized protein YbjT (DUF2867 family)
MNPILIAGATGTLGVKLVRELKRRKYRLKILVRKTEQTEMFCEVVDVDDEILVGQVTDPESIKGVARGTDAVISSVGITRQKDGHSYKDVDYGANRNLLNEALEAGVSRFVYIASLNGQEMRHLKMIEAKERFVDELKDADIGHTVVRPNGFFSDLEEVLRMAKKGRVYVQGDGLWKANPISTEDLAPIVVDLFEKGIGEAEIGGPEILTQKRIAELAFKALGKKPVITGLPPGLTSAAVKVLRLFTPISIYGPLEFFFEATSRDMIAECYGTKSVEQFFNEIKANNGSDEVIKAPEFKTE